MNLFHEDMLVKLYMKKFGISNVRGGTYSTLILTADQIKFLDTEITHSKNLCFHCKKILIILADENILDTNASS